MPIYYLDTSVIIKLYVNEPRTEVMIRLLDEIDSDDSLYTSWFTILELTSVILRLANGGRLDTNTADSIVAGFPNPTQVIGLQSCPVTKSGTRNI